MDKYELVAEAVGNWGGEVIEWNSFSTDFFNTMLRTLPAKYRRNLRQLCFYVHPNTWQDYVDSIAARQGAMADQYLAGMVGDPTYGGASVISTPELPEGSALLTNPNNLAFVWWVDSDDPNTHPSSGLLDPEFAVVGQTGPRIA